MQWYLSSTENCSGQSSIFNNGLQRKPLVYIKNRRGVKINRTACTADCSKCFSLTRVYMRLPEFVEKSILSFSCLIFNNGLHCKTIEYRKKIEV